MNPGIVVFLVGLFIVPFVLLWWSHRIRRASPRQQRAFWGAVVGHCIAGVLAISASMVTPEAWTSGETMRGAMGLWAMFVLPIVFGAAAAALAPTNR